MSVPAVPELSFRDFAAELEAKERRIPLHGTIETTFRCNLNCVHCYVSKPFHSGRTRAREMGLERLLPLLDEIADRGCLDLLLTGGEVLIRRDFPQLYAYAVRKGFRVTVFTNGTLVTEGIARLFGAMMPARVEITLYGMTAATYERITRVPGSFDRCMRGIMLLQGCGARLGLKTMLTKWNEHELVEMRTFARNLGIGFRHDALLNPRVDGLEIPIEELQLPPERVVAADLDVPSLRRRQRESASRLAAASGAGACEDRLFLCGAGAVSFNVDPRGGLQLCQLARQPSFDLRTGTFEQGWNGFLPALRDRCRSKASPCRTCTLLPVCSSCPGASQLEHGDPERPVARFCEITHRRVHALLGDFPGHRADAACCLNPRSVQDYATPARREVTRAGINPASTDRCARQT
ncbi:MAG TPA: radical SAM protein [Syntrophobacter fumaroxidans]|nr:radical SAM protein [Syntrophobacter fumaroxidans]